MDPVSGNRRIFVVDDQPLIRRGVADLIRGEAGLTLCGESDGGPDTFREIARARPHLVILETALRAGGGTALLKELRNRHPQLPILVLSLREEDVFAERVLRAGARAYVVKLEDGERLLRAIRKVLGGGVYLSERAGMRMLGRALNGARRQAASPEARLSARELEVVRWIGHGCTNREISAGIGISVKTVESHCANIKRKLDLKNANELMRFCVRWVSEESYRTAS